MLRDTAHIQEKDAEFVNKRLRSARSTAGPQGERRRTSSRSTRWPTPSARSRCSSARQLSHACQLHDHPDAMRAYDAGHMLGLLVHRACRTLRAGAPLRLIFSGDVGRPNLPIIRDPGAHAAGRLPDHGEHLRRPAAQERRARGQQAGGRGEPNRAARRTHHRARPSPWGARSNWCCCCTSLPTKSASRTSRSSWTARWR